MPLPFSSRLRVSVRVTLFALIALGAVAVTPARALDRLCDPGNEDCRAILIGYIRAENVQIDVGMWFMEDARYTAELAARKNAGVKIRVLVDPRANATVPENAARLNELQAAGIPMRKRIASGILHYKMMLFAGQGVVEFSGANYSADAWLPTGPPYTNYIDEAIYFTDDPQVVQSIMTKYDSLWTNTTNYANYANITPPLVASYPVYPKDPALNFPPLESYANRSVSRYNAETDKIDVIMYRITDRRHTDAIIAAHARGVPIRLISEPEEYRNPDRPWVSWNVDRLYVAGVQIKMRAHQGLNHQKLVLLYHQGMAIFGSSNWTSPSDNSQEEHNYFTTKPLLFNWLVDQFERKWNNSAGVAETQDFTPLPPDKAAVYAPANAALNVPTSNVRLRWYAGPWGQRYDVYFGTSPSTMSIIVTDQELGPSQSPTDYRSFTLPTSLLPGTTYYWQVVSRTMAGLIATSSVWSFTTAGAAQPPPPNGNVGPGDVVVYAADAAITGSAWSLTSDATAAGGSRLWNPNHNAAKIATAAATPASYATFTVNVEANKAYHFWMRGRGESNYWGNDSAFVQFSGSVTNTGAPTYRIGTTSAVEYNLESCGGCGIQGWGWQDNGYGSGVMGPAIYFAASGPQTIRIQQREDGLSVDQLVLSPSLYLSSSPGGLKNDTTILPRADGSQTGGGGGETGGPDIVLYASAASTVVGNWAVVSDASAAGGARMANRNLSAAKIQSASAAPPSYVEMTFNADAGKPYHLWMRGKAESNNWANDSVFVQFLGSVDSGGAATYRIGTTSAAEYNLEDCSGCGVAGWGWQDNGYTIIGPNIFFATTGPQTLRIQVREDGLSIDQIVLSPSNYLTASPGALKNDSTILPASDGSGGGGDDGGTTPGDEIVLYASEAPTRVGNWTVVPDAGAAGGARLRNPNAGAAKILTASTTPPDYVEMTFDAVAAKPYHLWMRGKADSNNWANDSVFMQFSGTIDSGGNPAYRIGTTNAAEYNLEDCSGCGVSNWGWQDNGYSTLGPNLVFSDSGPQTLRIQVREDGLSIDQIVLSATKYLTTPPGPLEDDTTILAKQN